MPLRRRPATPPPVAAQLAADITRRMEALQADRELIVLYYNLYRDRSQLLDVLTHPWHDHDAQDLLTLTVPQHDAAAAFYDALTQARLWALHTEDMPITLDDHLARLHERLEPLAARALDQLGPPAPTPEARPVPEAWRTFARSPDDDGG